MTFQLDITPDMTSKTNQMSVCPVRSSVRLSVQCQHFQNHKAPKRLDPQPPYCLLIVSLQDTG